MNLLKDLYNMLPFIGRECEADLWEKAVENRTKHTPDLQWLVNKETYLLFVYDDMKSGFPRNQELGKAKLVSNAITKGDDYVMWLRGYQGTTLTAVAAKAGKSRYEKLNLPGRPNTGHIKGQLFQINTESLLELDYKLSNGLYLERHRTTVQLPWHYRSWKKVNGAWRPTDEAPTARCFMYDVLEPEIIDDIKDNTFQEARPFYPARRPNNQHRPQHGKYYEFTRQHLNDK